MGKLSATSSDIAAVAHSATLTDAAASAWVIGLVSDWTLSVTGTFVGTVVLECSFDGGTTAVPVTGGTMTAPGTLAFTTNEDGVLHRVRFNPYTSGTAAVRLSGGYRKQ